MGNKEDLIELIKNFLIERYPNVSETKIDRVSHIVVYSLMRFLLA